MSQKYFLVCLKNGAKGLALPNSRKNYSENNLIIIYEKGM
jgi:hypothetical protein